MAAVPKTIVLITGANSGIGFELAAQLMANGSYHVLMGSRSSERGNAAVKDLLSRNLPGTAAMLPIDVTNDKDIKRAVNSVEREHGKLDILVNNAGIAGLAGIEDDTFTLRERMRAAFDTNATGVAIVTQSFASLLRTSSKTPRIVNVSTELGSISERLEPSGPYYKLQEVQYRASKAALNMITSCQWVEYGPAIKVFAVCPGFVVSNLAPQNKAENGAKPVSEGVASMLDILEGKRDFEAGRLLHSSGLCGW